jgi:alkylhydroperoxidase family enzyme
MSAASTANPRIAPAQAPYEPAIAQAFERIMPPGVAPLTLFRTMARSPRVLQRMFAGSLLDHGDITLRQRELVILRTCARCGSEYEWGVHASFFAAKAGIDEGQLQATLAVPPDRSTWNAAEVAILDMVDQLHDSAGITDALWQELAQHFTPEQLLELIALTGYYHTISYLTNGLRIAPEPYARRFTQTAPPTANA